MNMAPVDWTILLFVLGVLVGGDAGGTTIGAAPGAQWIAVPGICNTTMPDGYADNADD